MTNGTILLFDIVNVPFLDGDVPRRTLYGVYISQLIRYARATSNVRDFNCRNKALPSSLSRAIVIISYVRRFLSYIADTVSWLKIYNVSLVYRIRKIVGKSNFSEQFRKLINCYKRIGYNPYVMWQTACLVINATSVDSYASLFNCTTAVRASDSTTAST